MTFAMNPTYQTTVDEERRMQVLIGGLVTTGGRVIRSLSRSSTPVTSVSSDDGYIGNNSSAHNAFSWTDFEKVYVSTTKLRQALGECFYDQSNGATVDETNAALAMVMMSAYAAMKHEMLHILYTPGIGTDLYNALRRQRQYFRAWNILEDQRIEMLYMAKFPMLKQEFTVMIAQWVLGGLKSTRGQDVDDDVAAQTTYLLLGGRKYLPAKMREAFRDAYAGDADNVDRIVTEYLKVNPYSDWMRAWELIQEFHHEMANTESNIDEISDPNYHGVTAMDHQDDDTASQREELSEQAAKSAANDEALEELNEQLDDFKSADQEQDSGTTADESSDEEANGDAGGADPSDDESDDEATGTASSDAGDDGDTEQDGQSADGGNDADGDADGEMDGGSDEPGTASDDIDSHSGDGIGIGGDDSDATGIESEDEIDPWSAVNEVVDDVFSRADFGNEWDSLMSSIQSSSLSGRMIDRLGRSPVCNDLRATPEAISQARGVARQIARELRSIQAAVDPERHRHLRRGRIDMRTVVRGHQSPVPNLNIFRKIEGSDDRDTGLDILVTADMSGSMDSVGNENAHATADLAGWTIKLAMDAVRQPCTYGVFSTTSYVAYDSSERAPSHPKSHFIGMMTGFTQMAVAAESYFARPDANRNQVLVILTDGAWGDSRVANAVLQRLIDNGVHVVIFHLDRDIATKAKVAAVKAGRSMDDNQQSFLHTQQHIDHPCTWASFIDNPGDMVPVFRKLVRQITTDAVARAAR